MSSKTELPSGFHKLDNETTDLWIEDFKKAMLGFGKYGKAIRDNVKIPMLCYPGVDDCIPLEDGSLSNIRKYELNKLFALTSKGISDFNRDIMAYKKDIVSNDSEENDIILFHMATLADTLSKGINNNKDYIDAVTKSDSFEVVILSMKYSMSLSNVKNVLKRNNNYFLTKQNGLLEDFIKELFDRQKCFYRDMEDPANPGYVKITNLTATIFLCGLDQVEYDYPLREIRSKLKDARIDNIDVIVKEIQDFKNSMGDSSKERLDPGSSLALAAPAKVSKSRLKSDAVPKLAAIPISCSKICETCKKKFDSKKSRRGKWYIHCMSCNEEYRSSYSKKRVHEEHEANQNAIKPKKKYLSQGQKSGNANDDAQLISKIKTIMGMSKTTARHENTKSRKVTYDYDDMVEVDISDDDDMGNTFIAAGIISQGQSCRDSDDGVITIIQDVNEPLSDINYFTDDEVSTRYQSVEKADDAFNSAINRLNINPRYVQIKKNIDTSNNIRYESDGQMTYDTIPNIRLASSLLTCYFPDFRIYLELQRELQQHQLLVGRFYHQSSCSVCSQLLSLNLASTSAWINLFMCAVVRYAVFAKRNAIDISLVKLQLCNIKQRNHLLKLSANTDYNIIIDEVKNVCSAYILNLLIPVNCAFGVMVKLYSNEIASCFKSDIFAVHDKLMHHTKCVGYTIRYPDDHFGILSETSALYDSESYGMFMMQTDHRSDEDNDLPIFQPDEINEETQVSLQPGPPIELYIDLLQI